MSYLRDPLQITVGDTMTEIRSYELTHEQVIEICQALKFKPTISIIVTVIASRPASGQGKPHHCGAL